MKEKLHYILDQNRLVVPETNLESWMTFMGIKENSIIGSDTIEVRPAKLTIRIHTQFLGERLEGEDTSPIYFETTLSTSSLTVTIDRYDQWEKAHFWHIKWVESLQQWSNKEAIKQLDNTSEILAALADHLKQS